MFISIFTELHVHGDLRRPTEMTSNAYFRSVGEGRGKISSQVQAVFALRTI